MRVTMRTLVIAAMLMAGVGAAGAQILDGSTGVMVDASSDPMDYSLVASGQGGDWGSEIAASDFAAFTASVDAQNQANAAQDDTPAVPVIPGTPKPTIGPKAGTFLGAGQVTIADVDAAAKIFYTVDGKKPTQSSAIYAGPIAVSAKTKVRALAWDVNARPSGVANKTFKMKI